MRRPLRLAGQDKAALGELAAHLGLSVRAIRYYEAQGLIDCARDGSNRRLVDARARARLQVIAELRQAGIGLSDVAEVLAAGPVGGAEQLKAAERKLAEHSLGLEEERRRAARALAQVQERLGRISSPQRAMAGVRIGRG